MIRGPSRRAEPARAPPAGHSGQFTQAGLTYGARDKAIRVANQAAAVMVRSFAGSNELGASDSRLKRTVEEQAFDLSMLMDLERII